MQLFFSLCLRIDFFISQKKRKNDFYFKIDRKILVLSEKRNFILSKKGIKVGFHGIYLQTFDHSPKFIKKIIVFQRFNLNVVIGNATFFQQVFNAIFH